MGLEYKRLLNWPGLEKNATDNAYATKKHLHQELSLGYVMKGFTNLSIGHKKLFIQEGEGIFIPPFYVCQCEPIDINGWQFKMIYLNKSFLSEGMSQLSNYMKEPRILNVNQVSFLVE